MTVDKEVLTKLNIHLPPDDRTSSSFLGYAQHVIITNLQVLTPVGVGKEVDVNAQFIHPLFGRPGLIRMPLLYENQLDWIAQVWALLKRGGDRRLDDRTQVTDFPIIGHHKKIWISTEGLWWVIPQLGDSLEVECQKCESSGLLLRASISIRIASVCPDCKGEGKRSVIYRPFTGLKRLPRVKEVQLPGPDDMSVTYQEWLGEPSE